MLTKEQLMAMGMTEQQADSVLKAHNDALKNQYIPKHRFDEVNGKVSALTEQVKERDEQISKLSTFKGTHEELAKQLEQTKAENAKKIAEFEKKALDDRRRFACMSVLNTSTHDAELVAGLLNLDEVVVSDSGVVERGLSEQLAKLKETKSYLFKDVNPKGGKDVLFRGKEVNNPPVKGAGEQSQEITPEDFVKSLVRDKALDKLDKAEKNYFGGKNG